MRQGTIPFVKAHGLGNDFLLLEESCVAGRDLGELAARICDRHSNVGADGIVVLGAAEGVDGTFRIFNSDGSEASLSGNALRCAAALVASRRKMHAGKISFATAVGKRQMEMVAQRGATWVFRAEMGVPDFSAARVPFRPGVDVTEPIRAFPMPVDERTFPATILFMGNPQCIVFQDNGAEFDWQWAGARLERHPYFPDRANIGFVRVLRDDRIEVRFWERGAGRTLASGTGSCACAVAAHLNGKTGRRVQVMLERGEMEVNWRDDGMVELTGPAEIVAEGVLLADT